MAKIKKVIENGGIQYPATITDAVKNPNNGKTVTEELSELGSENSILNGSLGLRVKKISIEVYLDGSYIRDNGYQGTYAPMAVSKPIPLKNGDTLKVIMASTGATSAIAYKKSDGTYETLVIGRESSWSSPEEYIYSADSDISIYLSYRKEYGVDASVCSFSIKEDIENIENECAQVRKEISPYFQTSMSNISDTIKVEEGKITIAKGFSLIYGGNRYLIQTSSDFIISTLDNLNGTRVLRTFVYLDISKLNDSGSTYLDGDNAVDLFIVSVDYSYNKSHLLFATFYYQTPSGGLIESLTTTAFRKISALQSELTKLKDAANQNFVSAYFSNRQQPIFTKSGEDWSIKMPSSGSYLNLYDQNGNNAGGYAVNGETYKISAFQALVIHKGGIFEVISRASMVESDTTLFFNLVHNVDGLLVRFIETEIVQSNIGIGIYDDKVDEINQIKFRSDFLGLLFSDIHEGITNMERIVDLANSWGKSNIDAILNGGDSVNSVITDGLGWYNTLVDKCNVDVLSAIGNHDAWTNSSTWEWANVSDVRELVVSPILNKVSGVVSDGGLNYYKDYNGKVRVIVIETTTYYGIVPYWNDAASNWMQQVLEDARSKGLAVICMTHTPFSKEDGETIDASFNGWMGYRGNVSDSKGTITYDTLSVVDAAMENIDEFINKGGKFICWLAGHTHTDFFIRSKAHPRQVMFVTASARYDKGSDYTKTTDTNSPLYDCMNYIGIDLDRMWLKILRIGKNIDGYMRKKNAIVYDLTNQKVITNY